MAKHKIGDIIEFAYWLTGEETKADIDEFVLETKKSIAAYAQAESVLLSKGEISIKSPGEERCPPVPDHIHGANVHLMLIEARVLMDLPGPSLSTFADELEKDDFNRLAKITRDHYARRFPGARPLSDGQVRTVINDVGEEAALETLRGRIDDTTGFIQ